MRKILCFLIAIFMLMGCARIQLTDSQEVVGSILARHVGFELATSHSEKAAQLVHIAEAFVVGAESVLMLDTFISILTSDIDDPLLQADITDLSKLVKVEGPMITVEQMRVIKTIMNAFLQGVKMGGEL